MQWCTKLWANRVYIGLGNICVLHISSLPNSQANRPCNDMHHWSAVHPAESNLAPLFTVHGVVSSQNSATQTERVVVNSWKSRKLSSYFCLSVETNPPPPFYKWPQIRISIKVVVLYISVMASQQITGLQVQHYQNGLLFQSFKNYIDIFEHFWPPRLNIYY